MKKIQRLEMMELQDKDIGVWMSARKEAWSEMSDKYNFGCICGRLCTGLHERSCSKFQDAVNLRTITKVKKLDGSLRGGK